MPELTKLACAYINEWRSIEEIDRNAVLNVLNTRRHDHGSPPTDLTGMTRNAFATAAYLLVELLDD